MEINNVDGSQYIFANGADALRFVDELKRRYDVRSLKSASNITLVVDKSVVPEKLSPSRTAKPPKKPKPDKHYVIIGFDIPEEYAQRIATVVRKGLAQQLETVVEPIEESVEPKISIFDASIPALDCVTVFNEFDKNILFNPAVNTFLVTDFAPALLNNPAYRQYNELNIPGIGELRAYTVIVFCRENAQTIHSTIRYLRRLEIRRQSELQHNQGRFCPTSLAA